MKFSVLMSLYCKEEPIYLTLALDSIVNQTLPANEVVIVFDGPLPQSLIDIVEEFKNKLPLKIVLIEKNVGLGMALNEGLKHCSNEWVFRMDTDDICTPERFEKQIKYINHYPGLVILGSQIIEFIDDKEKLLSKNIRFVPTGLNEIKSFTLKRNPFNHMTILFKKSVIENVGGYQHHLYMEDYNLWLRVIGRGYEVANLDEPLVYARVGNNMLSRRRGWKYIKSEWQLMKLKRELKFQGYFFSLLVFIFRALPRLLPINFLSFIYKLLRK